MDFTAFGPLVGSLIQIGTPAISTAVQMAVGEIPVFGGIAGPLAGMGAHAVMGAIASKMGVSLATDDPATSAGTLATAIAADPDGAKQKLAELESEHTYNLATRDKDNADAAQQIGLLTLDAASSSRLARSWRPLTALGLAAFLGLQLVLPYVVWAAQWMGGHPPALPEPRFDVTVAVLSGLLGLGVMRTADKLGVAKAVARR